MGCDSSKQADERKYSKARGVVPCSPEDILNKLNDIRRNPTKYADLIEGQLKYFKDEYTIHLDGDVDYKTNEGKAVWTETVEFLRANPNIIQVVKEDGSSHK